MWVHSTTYHITVVDFTGYVTIYTSIAKGRIKPFKFYIVICAQRFVSVWMPWLIFSIPPVLHPLLPHNLSFLLKYSGCRFACWSLVFIYFILQSVLTGATYTRTVRLACLEVFTAEKNQCLFLLLGWRSLFLLMTDCPDFLSTGLTRKHLPLLATTQLYKHPIWAHTVSRDSAEPFLSSVSKVSRDIPTSCWLQDFILKIYYQNNIWFT